MSIILNKPISDIRNNQDQGLIRNQKNLYDSKRFCNDQYLRDTNGSVANSAGWAWSGYIKCKPLTTYSRNGVARNSGGATAYYYVWYYDEDFNQIGNNGDRGLTFTTIAGTVYMATNIKQPSYNDLTETFSFVEGQSPLDITSYKAFINTISEDIDTIKNELTGSDPLLLANTPHVSVRRSFIEGTIILSMYNEYICLIVGDRNASRTLLLLEDGWNSERKEIDIDTINANYLRWALFVKVSNSLTRLLLCFDVAGSQGEIIYHNYADDTNWDSWAESNIWGLPNTLNPVSADTTIYGGKTRPKYYKPSGSGNTFRFMGGTGYRNQDDSLWIGNYVSEPHTPSTVWVTYDGINFYAQYQYGINDTSPAATAQDIDFSGVSDTIPTDLQLQKRVNNVPSSVNREPTDVFTFSIAVDVSAIAVHDTTKTKVTATGHGLVTNDVICFRSALTTQNNNSWIAPSSFADIVNNDATEAWSGATPPGGNGKFYKVIRINDNEFYLHEAIGNPHNHFQCRHIHSIDWVHPGLVISTGEAGINSNFTLLYVNKVVANKVLGDFGQVHLTSDPTNAIQRSLGFYMDETHFLFPSDTGDLAREISMADRTDVIQSHSAGVFRGTISQLDDFAATDQVLGDVSVCYLFKKIGDNIFYGDMFGNLYISKDRGETWFFVCKFDLNIQQYFGHNRDKTKVVIGYWIFSIKQ